MNRTTPSRSLRVFRWPPSPVTAQRPAHAHSGFECNIVDTGTASCLVGRHRVFLRQGSVLWIAERRAHAIIETSADFTMWVIWTPDVLPKDLQSNPHLRALGKRTAADPGLRTPPTDAMQELLSACRLAGRHADEPQLGTAAATSALLLAASMAALPATDAAQRVHPAVSRAALLLQQPGVDDSLGAVAGQSGISAPRLSRLFTRELGMPFTQFRSQCRLRRFSQLKAARPRATLLALALEAGFGSYMQFYRTHVKLTGQRPGAV